MAVATAIGSAKIAQTEQTQIVPNSAGHTPAACGSALAVAGSWLTVSRTLRCEILLEIAVFRPEKLRSWNLSQISVWPNAELGGQFTIEEEAPSWGVVQYWYYPEHGPPEFTFDVDDEPIGFA